jgi:hypothetical protein
MPGDVALPVGQNMVLLRRKLARTCTRRQEKYCGDYAYCEQKKAYAEYRQRFPPPRRQALTHVDLPEIEASRCADGTAWRDCCSITTNDLYGFQRIEPAKSPNKTGLALQGLSW